MLLRPTTTLWQPKSRWSSSVYAYLSRSTLNCGLSGKELENRFPATSFISVHWFYVGSVELPAADENTPARELPRRMVIGKQGPLVTRNRGDILYFGISMYPDAFAAAFGIAAKDLEGRFVDASEVMPAHGMALFDAIDLATSDEERMALFEDFLQTHAGDFRVSLWTAAIRAGTRISVSLMSRLLKLGQRQTIRATRNALGVGVSDLRKFARGEAAFNELNASLEASRSISLADIAAHAGYADQAHLSRECKAVTGQTPGTFLRELEEEESAWIYRASKSIRRD
jgi:AraC-like DNA-binding protein